MLVEFARLSEGDCATDGRLLAFASQYGCLGLCKAHGGPQTHTKPLCPADNSDTPNGQLYRESILM